MKKLLVLLLALLCLSSAAMAEGCIVNLVEDPDAPYKFTGAGVLEIVFPRVYSSDCILVRYGDEVMMIDASTKNKTMQNRIRTAFDSVGVDHIDIAYNSHPHDDHIDGFPLVYEHTPYDRFIVTFPTDFDWRMKKNVKFMEENGIPVERMGHGDVITLGDGAVTLTIIQHLNEYWPVNDQSAMLMVQYGERRILLAGDNENRSQKYFAENLPTCGLKADIFKYPHHGQVKLLDTFLEAIDPELVFMNGAADVMDSGKKYLERKGVPYMLGYQGLTRMRTDGHIWVIDYVREIGADRELPYTPER